MTVCEVFICCRCTRRCRSGIKACSLNPTMRGSHSLATAVLPHNHGQRSEKLNDLLQNEIKERELHPCAWEQLPSGSNSKYA